jgi:ATP-dependent RNA helicase HelY
VTIAPRSQHDVRTAFETSREFAFDDFQRRSLDALDRGSSVLVAAPTGSGKTLVAEYAVELAMASGRKAFYTTPLKALSNQKFTDFTRRYGAPNVGLLTGDNSINGDAPIVVMTTEVLRNMIYGASPALDGLRYVVLDEVHYLQNRYRGAVWEEVIIHLPPEVDLVCLSATVSNAEQFADWIATVRGETEAVIEERRPVELRNLYMVGDRGADRIHLLPTLVGEGQDVLPNPELSKLDTRPHASRQQGWGGRRPRTRLYTPMRTDVIERLADESMLPAIYFIFSRAGCDQAVQQCINGGLRLTTSEQRAEIRAIAERHVQSLSDGDLRVLDYGSWLNGLESGFAAHHAGLVPPMKEAVEEAFATGLVQVVFATETLSLGINMPARSVVIEKLRKFTGEGHEDLTPGEYTQLTGRAGRRGIDELGYAIVLWSPFMSFDDVAKLASRRTYELKSSFRPTYNMAANLIRRYTPDAAHHLLNLSFAQFQSDGGIVRDEAKLERYRSDLAILQRDAACELGDVNEYRALETQLEELKRSESDRPRGFDRLRPGDVLTTRGAPFAVLSVKGTGSGAHISGLTVSGKLVRYPARSFHGPTTPVGRIELPVPYAPRNKHFQRQVVDALRKVRATKVTTNSDRSQQRRAVEQLLREHPVASCPSVSRHSKLARDADAKAKHIANLERSTQKRRHSLADQLDQVLGLLESWRYVDGWQLTDRGALLAQLYAETDLIVSEALAEGVFNDLTSAEMAALVSCLTYETRGIVEAKRTPNFTTKRLRERWGKLERLSRDLALAEGDAGLPVTRDLDADFAELAYHWASGRDLEDLLGDDEMSGGDFVRTMKQLLDLLHQIGDVAPVPETAATARAAGDGLFRGVVAASSAVQRGGEPT